MIVEALLDLISKLLKFIFGPLQLPDMPVQIQTVLDKLEEIIISGIGLLSIFVDLDVLGVLIPIVIVLINFEYVWKLIMFILRKIPFVGVE